MSDEALEAARRLLDYIGSPRIKMTFAHDAEIVARALLSRDAEVQKLRERLEIDHFWQLIDGRMTKVPVPEGEDIPDGIECRDETIKLQDRHIAELKVEITRLRALLARDAERDAVIEECARVALRASRHYEDGGWGRAACESIAYQIRKLKTAGQPSADGGKEGD